MLFNLASRRGYARCIRNVRTICHSLWPSTTCVIFSWKAPSSRDLLERHEEVSGSLFFFLLVLLLGVSGVGFAGTQYIISNDDLAFPFLTGVGFFTVGPNGVPVFQQQVQTGQYGGGGGYFGMNRIAVLNSRDQQCVFASEARFGDIVGIAISTLTVAGSAGGSDTDAGTSNGIGLAMNSNYLYASFSDSNTIGTFPLNPVAA